LVADKINSRFPPGKARPRRLALLSPVGGVESWQTTAGASLAASAALGLSSGQVLSDDKKDEPEEEAGAAEDLMREHGVLNRILLIYEEGLRRLRAKEEVTPDVFHEPATLVRKFVRVDPAPDGDGPALLALAPAR
jgi:hypothetical protein